jgi:hypothetical protein
MNPNEKRGLYTLMIVILMIVALLAWRSAEERAADQAKLKSTLAALGTQISQRTQAAATADRQVDLQVAQAKTPDQQAALIAALVGLKQAPTIVTIPSAPAPTPAQSADSGDKATKVQNVQIPVQSATLPDAPQPGDMVVPKAEIPQLVQHEADCKKDANDLAACNANLADTARQRDAAVAAFKGGSWWTRVKRNGKWFGLGAALGIGAGFAAHR